MASPVSSTTTATTTTISFSPPHRASSKFPDYQDLKPSSLRASCRENGIARNRRRSLSQIALLDVQNLHTSQAQPSSHALQQQQQQRHPTHHPRARASSLCTTNHTLTDTLLPTLSPAAQSHFEAYSPDRPYFPGGTKSLAGIALRAFCLGAALAVGLVATLATLLLTKSPLWRLPFFLVALATFHFLEFWTTAAYNTREAEVSSFLLTANWPAYAIAHTAAAVECLVTNVFFPDRQWAPFHLGTLTMVLGLALVVVGQVVRSAAMVQAGPSFNHIVQQTQKREHILVTTGIYGSLRHPSYFGFFWWGLGTQLAMGNVVCFVAYAAVLWRFFSTRVRHEEMFLVKFFGEEYVDYRKKVGTKIPFVP